MAEVKIRGISKAYSSGVPVLKGVDLDIHAGELFFFAGPLRLRKINFAPDPCRIGETRYGQYFI